MNNKVFSVVKKVICAILLLIIVPIIVFNLIIITKRVVFKDNSPSIFGYSYFSVLTGSMEPAINVGDIIIVKNGEYHINDIISYKDGDSVVTHRIVDIFTNEEGKELYTTKGDNNNTEDRVPISKEDVYGRVIRVIPKLGNIILFLRKNIIFLVILFLILIFIDNISNNKNKELPK